MVVFYQFRFNLHNDFFNNPGPASLGLCLRC